jgi:cellulose biosynthesis protein BcsQ
MANVANVLVVTSGKGGVGKTTTTAALGAALAQAGKKVAVVDFDVGLRNLDLVMGAERRVVFDLINVVQGMAKLSQALIRDKRIETLWLLPASQTRDKDALTEAGVAGVIREPNRARNASRASHNCAVQRHQRFRSGCSRLARTRSVGLVEICLPTGPRRQFHRA